MKTSEKTRALETHLGRTAREASEDSQDFESRTDISLIPIITKWQRKSFEAGYRAAKRQEKK